MSITSPPNPGAAETVREEAVWLVATLRHHDPADRSIRARALVEMRASDQALTYDHLEDMKVAAAEAGRLADVERLVRDQRHVRSATWAVRQRHARSSNARTQRDRTATARVSMRSPEYAEARDRALAELVTPPKIRVPRRAAPAPTSRPAPSTPGRRASTEDGNGGSSGESDPGDPEPGELPAPGAKWDEHRLPTDGAAYTAFRDALADLAVLAHRWDIPLQSVVQADVLRTLSHECSRRDFGPTVRADRAEAADRIADAIDAVAAWHTETVRRLRWVRFGIHEDPRRTRSAA